jgi:hypothetical protein
LIPPEPGRILDRRKYRRGRAEHSGEGTDFTPGRKGLDRMNRMPMSVLKAIVPAILGVMAVISVKILIYGYHEVYRSESWVKDGLLVLILILVFSRRDLMTMGYLRKRNRPD